MEPESRPSPSTTIVAEAGLVHIRLDTPDGGVSLWTRPENARRLALLLLATADAAEAQIEHRQT